MRCSMVAQIPMLFFHFSWDGQVGSANWACQRCVSLRIWIHASWPGAFLASKRKQHHCNMLSSTRLFDLRRGEPESEVLWRVEVKLIFDSTTSMILFTLKALGSQRGVSSPTAMNKHLTSRS